MVCCWSVVCKIQNIVSNTNAEAISRPNAPSNSQVTKRAAGKPERVFVDLDMLYPNPNDPTEETSIEEVRAARRGWLDRDWPQEEVQMEVQPLPSPPRETRTTQQTAIIEEENQLIPEAESSQSISAENSREPRAGRSRKMGIMEMKGETQTSRTLSLQSRNARTYCILQLKRIWILPRSQRCDARASLSPNPL